MWWAILPAPVGRRPVFILTRTGILDRLANVTVAPLTRTIRGIPSEVELTLADGVPSRCVVLLDAIVTIPQTSLQSRIVRVSQQKLDEVLKAIRFAFDMP